MENQEDQEVAEILSTLDFEEIKEIKNLFLQICLKYRTQTITLEQAQNYLNTSLTSDNDIEALKVYLIFFRTANAKKQITKYTFINFMTELEDTQQDANKIQQLIQNAENLTEQNQGSNQLISDENFKLQNSEDDITYIINLADDISKTIKQIDQEKANIIEMNMNQIIQIVCQLQDNLEQTNITQEYYQFLYEQQNQQRRKIENLEISDDSKVKKPSPLKIKLLNENQQLEEEISLQIKKLTQLQNQTSQLEKEKIDLNDENIQLKQDLIKLKEHQKSPSAKLQKEKQQLEEEFNVQLKRIQKLQKTNKNLLREKQYIKQENIELKNDQISLKSKLDQSLKIRKDLEQEIKNKAYEKKRVAQLYDEMEQSHDKLLDENEKLKSIVEIAKEQIEKQGKILNQLKEIVQAKEVRLQNIEKMHNDTKENYKYLQVQLEFKQHSIKELEEKISKKDSTIDDKQIEQTTSYEKNQITVNNLQEQINQVKHITSQKQINQEKSFTEQLLAKNKKIALQELTIAQLEQDKYKQQQQLQKLNQNLESQKEKTHILTQKLEGLMKEKQKAENFLNHQIQQQKEEIQNQKQLNEQRVNALQKKIKLCNETFNIQENNSKKEKTFIKSLKEQLDSVKKKSLLQTKKLAIKDQTIKEHDNQISDLKQIISNLNIKKGKLKKQLDQQVLALNNKIKLLSKEISESKLNIQAGNQEKQKLQNELNKIKKFQVKQQNKKFIQEQVNKVERKKFKIKIKNVMKEQISFFEKQSQRIRELENQSKIYFTNSNKYLKQVKKLEQKLTYEKNQAKQEQDTTLKKVYKLQLALLNLQKQIKIHQKSGICENTPKQQRHKLKEMWENTIKKQLQLTEDQIDQKTISKQEQYLRSQTKNGLQKSRKNNLKRFLEKNFDYLNVRKNSKFKSILNEELYGPCFSDMIFFIDSSGEQCKIQEQNTPYVIVITKLNVNFINTKSMKLTSYPIKNIHKLTMFPKLDLILCMHYGEKELVMETFRKLGIFRFLMNITQYYHNSKKIKQAFEDDFASSRIRSNMLRKSYQPLQNYFKMTEKQGQLYRYKEYDAFQRNLFLYQAQKLYSIFTSQDKLNLKDISNNIN